MGAPPRVYYRGPTHVYTREIYTTGQEGQILVLQQVERWRPPFAPPPPPPPKCRQHKRRQQKKQDDNREDTNGTQRTDEDTPRNEQQHARQRTPTQQTRLNRARNEHQHRRGETKTREDTRRRDRKHTAQPKKANRKPHAQRRKHSNIRHDESHKPVGARTRKTGHILTRTTNEKCAGKRIRHQQRDSGGHRVLRQIDDRDRETRQAT